MKLSLVFSLLILFGTISAEACPFEPNVTLTSSTTPASTAVVRKPVQTTSTSTAQ